MIDAYITFVSRLIGGVISCHSLQIGKHDKSVMGEWFVYFENSEFVLSIEQDHSEYTSIELGSKVRRKPRAQLRGPWSMSHLKGYLDGSTDHYRFKSIQEEELWLEKNESKLFDSSFLNSNDLNQWASESFQEAFWTGCKVKCPPIRSQNASYGNSKGISDYETNRLDTRTHARVEYACHPYHRRHTHQIVGVCSPPSSTTAIVA